MRVLRRVWSGFSQDLLRRTCTRSCKDLSKRVLSKRSSHKGTRVLCEPAQWKWPWAMDISQESFHARILREHATPQDRDNCTTGVCEPAQSTCKRTSHKSPVYARIYRKTFWTTNGAPWSPTSLDSYCKNPSVWTHCLGKDPGIARKMCGKPKDALLEKYLVLPVHLGKHKCLFNSSLLSETKRFS